MAETDFIFAAIGEELGLLGSTAILAAYLLMVGAGLRIALRAEAPFDKLLAAGLTTILGLQAFIIIGGVIRLVPLTGITLPFVSYGGSSLVANYVLLALLDAGVRRLRPPTPVAAEVAVNRQIRRLGIGLVVLYAALFVQLNVVQVLRADDYNDNPNNRRAVTRDFNRPRGQILAAGGECWPGRCRSRARSSSSGSTPRAPSSATSPASSPSPPAATGSRRPTTTSWPDGPRRPRCATSPTSSSTTTTRPTSA